MFLEVWSIVSRVWDHSGNVRDRSIGQSIIFIQLHPGVINRDNKELNLREVQVEVDFVVLV
jgi:hypothetical protein